MAMKQLHTLFFSIAALLAPILCAQESASEYGYVSPFESRTANPIRLGILDPNPMNAIPLGEKRFMTTVQLEYVSVFWSDDTRTPALYFADGELTRINISAGYGVSDKLDIVLDLPFYSWQAGFLDRPLTDYHEILSVPNAGREDFPFDVLRNEVRDTSGSKVWKGEGRGAKGGDISAWFRYHLLRDDDFPVDSTFDLALRGGIKLPTGSRSGGFSSEHLDLNAGLLASLRMHRIGLDSSLDVVIPTGHSLDDSPDYDVLPFAKFMLSLQLAVSSKLYGVAQIAAYSPSFSTDINNIENVDGISVLGTFGGVIKFDNAEFQFGVGEDMNQQGEADFSLLVALKFNW